MKKNFMIFKQLFDQNSSTYTYIVANRIGGEALIIDPVLENSQKYITLLEELDVKLLKAIDTHIHADHFSALSHLRDSLNCVTVMGEQSNADIVSIRIKDNDNISIDGITFSIKPYVWFKVIGYFLDAILEFNLKENSGSICGLMNSFLSILHFEFDEKDE